MRREVKALAALLGVLGVAVTTIILTPDGEPDPSRPTAPSGDGEGRGDPGTGPGESRSRANLTRRARPVAGGESDGGADDRPADSPVVGPRASESANASGPQAAIDTVEALLSYLATPRAAVPDHTLPRDAVRFRRLFERGSKAPAIHWQPGTVPRVVENGATVVFGAGRHELDGRRLFDFENHSDVLLDGDGMEKTLLVLAFPIWLPHGSSGFTIADMTIDCRDRPLVGVAGTALLRIVRCRVVGFDGGFPGGQLVRGSGGGLLAEDSKFESGFGIAPGEARLLNTAYGRGDAHVTTLGRFERCEFVGPFAVDPHTRLSFYRLPPSNSVVFESCKFLGCGDADRSEIAAPIGGGRFIDCVVVPPDAAPGASRTRRSVSELNPAWAEPRASAAPPR